MPSTFHVEHFGCRAARADGEAIGDRLRAQGHCEQQPNEADVVIVNTCSVTAEADRAARAFIRRAHRLNPQARIVVTGCYAQRAPHELAAIHGVAAVVGNSHKALAPGIILGLAQCQQGEVLKGHDFSRAVGPQNEDAALAAEGMLRKEHGLVRIQSLATGSSMVTAPIWADDLFAHSFLEEMQLVPGSQTRPNLKIQEGCGNRCSFCVIPQTRGSSKSLPGAAVLRQVEGFVAAGGNELVLSGINLGRWGRDLEGFAGKRAAQRSWLPTLSAELGGKDGAPSVLSRLGDGPPPSTLAELVRQIFRQTTLPRLRLSSIEPMDWDAELIALMAEFGGSRLARHAHLPLQSGSDAVLRRMHRRYRPWHYAEKVHALLRAAGSALTLGADVMVGFPGETDGEFDETVAMIRALPFGYLHLFPFSPRPGTRAWALHKEHPVPAAVVDERMAVLRALGAEKSNAHRGSFIGRPIDAITLHTPPELAALGRTSAMAENFLPIEIADQLPANRLVKVLVTGLNAEGTLAAQPEPAQQLDRLQAAISV
jgi:threonylcarbamoyladenosine tRNA methylthiotransferase MtaB